MPPPHEESDLSTHVALCQLRYEGLQVRLGNLERLLSKLLWTVGGGFLAIVVTMIGYILTRIP
jgi:hypothetical protein